MPTFATERVTPCPITTPLTTAVLGTSLVVDLEQFPELNWIETYLTHLHTLQHEHDRLTHAIQAITQEGDVYRDYWIETYTKRKNGKQYTYHQLRWLTGERKKSGQPHVKTKHLPQLALAEVRAAIARGHQVVALEQQQQVVAAHILRLQHLVRGTGQRLQKVCSQNSPGATMGITRSNHHAG